MTARPQPWDRQEGETSPAWRAFVTYRDLGYDRSLRGAAEELQKAQSLLARWSSRHQWVVRAQAYDTHLDQVHQKRLRARRTTSEQRLLRIVDKGMEKLEAAFEGSLDLTDPAKLSRLMAELVKAERLVMGGPTSSVSVTGATSGPDFSSLTDEERQAQLRVLKAELERRSAAAVRQEAP